MTRGSTGCRRRSDVLSPTKKSNNSAPISTMDLPRMVSCGMLFCCGVPPLGIRTREEGIMYEESIRQAATNTSPILKSTIDQAKVDFILFSTGIYVIRVLTCVSATTRFVMWIELAYRVARTPNYPM